MRQAKKTIVIHRRSQCESIRRNRPQTPLCVARKSVMVPQYAQTQVVNPPKQESVEPVFISTIQDPKCIELRTRYETDKTFDGMEVQDLEILSTHLREYELQCGAKRTYDEAEEARNMQMEIKREIMRRNSLRAIDNTKQKATEEKKRKDEESLEQELREHDEETETMRQEMYERQRQKKEEFIHEWQYKKPEQYRKASVQLLNMKTIEKALVRNGEYASAREMQKRIQTQEQIEVEIQQDAMNEDYIVAMGKFEANQKAEMELFEHKRSTERELWETKRRGEMRVHDARLTVLRQMDTAPDKKFQSTGETNTVSYGQSFARFARESKFDIQPLLPSLKPPTGKRRVKINEEARKPIIARPPRAAIAEQKKLYPEKTFQTQLSEEKMKKKVVKPKEEQASETQEEKLQPVMQMCLTDIVEVVRDEKNADNKSVSENEQHESVSMPEVLDVQDSEVDNKETTDELMLPNVIVSTFTDSKENITIFKDESKEDETADNGEMVNGTESRGICEDIMDENQRNTDSEKCSDKGDNTASHSEKSADDEKKISDDEQQKESVNEELSSEGGSSDDETKSESQEATPEDSAVQDNDSQKQKENEASDDKPIIDGSLNGESQSQIEENNAVQDEDSDSSHQKPVNGNSREEHEELPADEHECSEENHSDHKAVEEDIAKQSSDNETVNDNDPEVSEHNTNTPEAKTDVDQDKQTNDDKLDEDFVDSDDC